MSIHGNQNVLPVFIPKEKIPQLNENEELAISFYLLTKDMNSSEKIMSFSRLLWPFLSIQGVISTHIFLDGLLIFSKKDKLTNPPRQPLIGHILRNIENRTQIEQLNRVIEVLSYKDTEAEEIGEGEESEFQSLEVNGLIDPEFLKDIMSLIPLLENKPIADYMPLDPSLNTEQALNTSEKYRGIVETMKGNALRWETATELISKVVDKWLTDLNVKIKDTNSRYSSQINKTTSTIDDSQIQDQLEKERDLIDQWKVNEKKKVIESISALFKTPERHMEDMLKKNKFFVRDETLKSKNIEQVLPNFEKHFDFLKDQAKSFIETVENLTQTYEEYKSQVKQIDAEAEERLEKLQVKLNIELQDRDKQIGQFEAEKEQTVTEMEELKNKLDTLYNDIQNIIQTKKANCLKEKDELVTWSVEDKNSEFFSKPIQWIYMPVYVMFIEDEDMMEERMDAVFPGYVSKDNLYTPLSDTILNVKNATVNIVEDDMKVRSNFEFSCENKNYLEDTNLKKKIQKGISVLRNKNLINDQIEAKIRESLKNLQ